MSLELLEFGVLVNLLVNWYFGWLLPSHLAIVGPHYPKCIHPLLSLNLSSPHYNLSKVLLIVLRTLHFSGGEFESLSKHIVDCILGMSFK